MKPLSTAFLLALALSAGLGGGALAQQGRGEIARRQQAAQAAKQGQMIAEQKTAMAKANRDEAFEARLAGMQSEIDRVKAVAAAENRALTPAEETTVAGITERMAFMRANREADAAQNQQQIAQAREDAQRRNQRNQTMREDRCRVAGTHQNRIDRRKGVGC